MPENCDWHSIAHTQLDSRLQRLEEGQNIIIAKLAHKEGGFSAVSAVWGAVCGGLSALAAAAAFIVK